MMFDWLRSKKKSKKSSSAIKEAPWREDPQKALQAALLCQQAIALVDRGQREDALALFQKAVITNPAYPLAWSDMGICLVELKRYEQAIEALEKAFELRPNDFATLVNLAKASAALGHTVQAKAYIAAARRMSPHDNALAQLEKQLG